MRLSDEETAMLAEEFGQPRRCTIAHQIAVGEFFDAAHFVRVSQAHLMADTDSLGEAGVRFSRNPCCCAGNRAAGEGTDDHRSARHRFCGLSRLGRHPKWRRSRRWRLPRCAPLAC